MMRKKILLAFISCFKIGPNLHVYFQVYGGEKLKLGTFGAYTITLTRPIHTKTSNKVFDCYYVSCIEKIPSLVKGPITVRNEIHLGEVATI